MSHMISEYDTVYTSVKVAQGKAWHGLETALEHIMRDGSNAPDVFAPIVECGFKPDFESPVCTLSAEAAQDIGLVDFSDWKILLADLRLTRHGIVLPVHVPKRGYKVHQNRTLFDAMIGAADSVLGATGYEIATLGTCGAYSQFFVSIAVKGHETFNVGKLANGANDDWNQYYNCNSSHNGLIASTVGLSTVRQVCFNTVQMAIADAEAQGTSAGIRHTVNSGELVTPEAFARNLATWIERADMFRQTLAMLKAMAMDLQGFRHFAAGVFTQAKSDELSTNSWNRIVNMESLFTRGAGNSGQSVYDGINAFTEYFTHGAGVGGRDVSAGKRVASANFGRGNDWKLECLRVASNEETYNDSVKRGAILYSDKALVQAQAN